MTPVPRSTLHPGHPGCSCGVPAPLRPALRRLLTAWVVGGLVTGGLVTGGLASPANGQALPPGPASGPRALGRIPTPPTPASHAVVRTPAVGAQHTATALPPPPATLPRDPLRPPAAALTAAGGDPASPGGGAATPAPSPTTSRPPRLVIVMDGVPRVVERGWPRRPGERLGDTQLERVDPQALWLRDPQGQLQRWPLYPGVTLQPSSRPAEPAPTPGAKEARP
ncbi:hypothetical protein [Ideonella livida]|uniref:Uncharacterized protein n=1 Tax=Ideonella livida TaxID=2707176 RepID=A0A7C9PFN2_9BURK|nr:hypothetical protein [Ideonella livida]NDY89874.1 hypothetical protein [Ideonella livida]